MERVPEHLTYLLPWDGRAMYDRFLEDICRARRRVVVVCFLPPCPGVGEALVEARLRVPAPDFLVLADGSTRESLSRFDVPWVERRVLPAGSIHAKVAVLDDVAWWGSWNLSHSAIRQVDVVQRVSGDPELVERLAGLHQRVVARSRSVELGGAARGTYRGCPERTGEGVPPGYDPKLGF